MYGMCTRVPHICVFVCVPLTPVKRKECRVCITKQINITRKMGHVLVIITFTCHCVQYMCVAASFLHFFTKGVGFLKNRAGGQFTDIIIVILSSEETIILA
jgi:hypothetical protein